MKVTVDVALCNGCGLCETICPEVFRMTGGNGSGLAVVRSENPPEAMAHFCRDARDCCKPHAILLSDDEARPRFGGGGSR